MRELFALAASILVVGLLVLGAAGLKTVYQNNAKLQNGVILYVAVSAGMQDQYAVSGYQYATGSIPLSNLVNGGKIPQNAVPKGTQSFNFPWGSTPTIAGATTFFNVTDAAAPYDICAGLMTNAQMTDIATSITVGGGTAITLPTDPTTATTACGSSGTVSMVVAMKGQ